MLEKFHDGARFFPPKNNFDDFVALVIGALISHIIDLGSPILNFKFKRVVDIVDVVLIELGVEKLLEDDGLVAPQGEILAADEGGEEAEVFGGHVAFGWAGLFEEGFYLAFYYLLVYHVFDWFCVVFEDGQKALLDERFVDVVGVFDEIL